MEIDRIQMPIIPGSRRVVLDSRALSMRIGLRSPDISNRTIDAIER